MAIHPCHSFRKNSLGILVAAGHRIPSAESGFTTKKCVDWGLGGPGVGWPPGLPSQQLNRAIKGPAFSVVPSTMSVFA